MRSTAGPVRGVAGAILAVFFAFSPAAAQAPRSGPATFAVRVTDSTGNPLSGVRVSLSGPAERSSTTEGGLIAFENLPVGTYHLRFEHPDFETQTKDAVGKRGAPVQVAVALTPKPTSAPPPPPTQPSEPPPVPAEAATPLVVDLPTFIEEHYVGKSAGKETQIGCAAEGTAMLIQINEPLPLQTNATADEFVYVIAGQGALQINGRDEPVAAGAFLVVPRGVPHAFAVGPKKPLVMVATRTGEGCGK